MTAAAGIDVRLDELAPAELQATAREAYRQAVADGNTPTGAVLGQWFGRSERWGRDRIAECRAHADGDMPAADSRTATADGHTPLLLDVDSRGQAAVALGQMAQPLVPQSAIGSASAAALADDGIDGSRPVAGPEVMWSRRVIRWVTTAAVIVVAACAARSSYEHQRTVVEMAGNPDAAWYLPLSVDGMMLIASLNMLVRRWDAQPAGWLTWTALLLGGAASLAANIAAAPPTLIGRLVAAWSPICLIVSYELLMQQLPHRGAEAGREGRQP